MYMESMILQMGLLGSQVGISYPRMRDSPVSDPVRLAASVGPAREVSTASAQNHVGLSIHHSQCGLGNLRQESGVRR